MSEATRRILTLLSQGKLTVDEADALLAVVDGEEPPAAGADAPHRRYFRVAVRKPGAPGEREKHVSIRVPIALVRGGMRLGAIISGSAGDAITRRLRERGFDIDLSKLSADQIETILKDLGDVTLEVDEGEAQVRITCE